MTTPQMDWLDDQRRKRAVSSDDIVTRLRVVVCWCNEFDGVCDACQAADQIERLRFAIDAVLLAIIDKGSHPEYHDEVRHRHERDWPTLWRAIAGLREARRG